MSVRRLFLRPGDALDATPSAVVEDAPPDRALRAATDPAPQDLTLVLARPDRAALAGARAAAAHGAGVVACWTGAEPGSGSPEARIASAGARRAARAAAGCGVDVAARGRLAHVALPADDAQAVAAVARLRDLGLGLVVVLAGPWGAPFVPLLEQRRAVLVDGSDAARRACRAAMARHAIDVRPLPGTTGPVSRALLRGGWGGRACVDRRDGEVGQALPLLVSGLLIVLLVVGALGGVAAAMGSREDRQRTVDLAALAAADRMRADWPDRAGVPARLSPDAYRRRAVAAAAATAQRNGLDDVRVDFPDGAGAATDGGPLVVRVRAGGRTLVHGVSFDRSVSATAELSPPAPTLDEAAAGAEYDGALAHRDGKPNRTF